jgi:ACS family hexuronate transporter-like MFS transporter
MERLNPLPPAHPASWKWWICGLLLFASMINYMDRQTLANASVRITSQFQLRQEQYGNLEMAFGWAFAAGSFLFGFVADRWPLRWVYPAVLFLWSATGFATGLVHDYAGLLVCRTFLGFFEAGHWPCAIKTTQLLLTPSDRALGNGILQSGTSLGAVITPLIMRVLMTDEIGSWRFSFQAVGLFGIAWIAAWFFLVGKNDLQTGSSQAAAPAATGLTDPGLWRAVFSRRMLIVLIMVACINTCWQILRAWLPKFLMEGRGYAEASALYFNSLFYVASDAGCLGAGALAVWLAQRGPSLLKARLSVFFIFAILTALTTVAALSPPGWFLLAILLLVGAGALGVFPVYHALSQDISARHQGKITGLAGLAAWGFSPVQKYFGRLVDQTGSFNLGLGLAGWLPLLAFVCLWLGWRKTETATTQSS